MHPSYVANYLLKRWNFCQIIRVTIVIRETMGFSAIIFKSDDRFGPLRCGFDELKAWRYVTIIRHSKVEEKFSRWYKIDCFCEKIDFSTFQFGPRPKFLVGGPPIF